VRESEEVHAHLKLLEMGGFKQKGENTLGEKEIVEKKKKTLKTIKKKEKK